jgi:RNA recognition motif-containing protein
MTSKILIGNIAEDTTEQLLREMLAQTIGKVVELTIPQDSKTHKHRGYAVVELPDDISVDRIVKELDGYLLNGRALTITVEQRVSPKRKWYELGKR